jgi:hypothetical protein
MSVFLQLGCALPNADGFRGRYEDRELGFHLTFNSRGKRAVDIVKQMCLLNQRNTNTDSMVLLGPARLP